MAIGQELLNVPMGEMIREMAFSIADAQQELDESSIQVAEMMGGTIYERDDEGNVTGTHSTKVLFGGDEVSMMELGFSPTFYQFVDTLIEVKIDIRISRERERTREKSNTRERRKKRRGKLFGEREKRVLSTSTVNASYSSKYSYSAEGSSLLRTKLVPVPPPAMLEERIQELIEENEAADASTTTTT